MGRTRTAAAELAAMGHSPLANGAETAVCGPPMGYIRVVAGFRLLAVGWHGMPVSIKPPAPSKPAGFRHVDFSTCSFSCTMRPDSAHHKAVCVADFVFVSKSH